MQDVIYDPSPHRGWLPWVWLAPAICIVLVALSSVPIDLLLERWSLLARTCLEAPAVSLRVRVQRVEGGVDALASGPPRRLDS